MEKSFNVLMYFRTNIKEIKETMYILPYFTLLFLLKNIFTVAIINSWLFNFWYWSCEPIGSALKIELSDFRSAAATRSWHVMYCEFNLKSSVDWFEYNINYQSLRKFYRTSVFIPLIFLSLPKIIIVFIIL